MILYRHVQHPCVAEIWLVALQIQQRVWAVSGSTILLIMGCWWARDDGPDLPMAFVCLRLCLQCPVRFPPVPSSLQYTVQAGQFSRSETNQI